jgi:hypothetical protein
LESLSNGIVNLFALMQYQGGGEASHLFFPSGSQGWRRNLLPELKSFSQLLTASGGGQSMPARAEVLGDRAVGREEPLGVARGLKPLHVSLSPTGRLMRILRTVVQIPMLAMFHPWEQLALGSTIALQLVGNDHARDVGQAFQEFAEELLRRPLVAPALHQNVEHVALLIHRPS